MGLSHNHKVSQEMKSKPTVLWSGLAAVTLACAAILIAHLRHTHAKHTRDWVIVSDTRSFKGYWSPDEARIPAIIAASKGYLQELLGPPPRTPRDEKDITEILGHWDHFICQVVPYQKNGKRYLHLSFLPKRFREEDFADWTRHYIQVDDGGWSYWRVFYDIEAGKFVGFSANGVV